MEQKTFKAPLRFKADGQTGEVEAVFATMGVVDLDGDITVEGAFGEQRVIIEPWNHNYQQLPVGKGVISERGSEAVLSGQFFMDMEAGRAHYQVAKELDDMQEWSYTFFIDDYSYGKINGQDVRFLKKMTVIGVGQVVKGAGIDTRTTALKSAKRALPSHSTATTDAAWDGPANEARARSDESAAYYRRIFAWADPEGDPAVKSTYKFVHHMVDGDGNPGAANVRACQTGIGVLNGGRGGTTIPDADRQGVWNHLAAHLRDAEVEPPELKGEGEDREVKPSDDLLTRINICEIEIRSLL